MYYYITFTKNLRLSYFALFLRNISKTICTRKARGQIPNWLSSNMGKIYYVIQFVIQTNLNSLSLPFPQ